METINAVVVIGLGVAFGLTLMGLLHALIELPQARRRKRQRLEMLEMMDHVIQDMDKVFEKQKPVKRKKVVKKVKK